MEEQQKLQRGGWGRQTWIGIVTLTILVATGLLLSSPDQGSAFHQLRRGLKQIEWGGIFNSGASSNGNFPKMGCQLNGKDICCSATENVEKKVKKPKNPTHHHCTTTKEYFPSPYEKRHLEVAEEIAKITELKESTVKFIDFIESPEEIEHARRWLERVVARQPGIPMEENDVDREYLSRFKVTRKCANMANHSWWEYIEPLSVHARHPFGLGECWHPHHRDQISVYNGKAPKASLLSVDFLLLQSPHDLIGHANSSMTHPTHLSAPSGVFLLDGGTSRFDSSLYWFVCVYQQVNSIPLFSFSPSPVPAWLHY
jgi:hypothetical protein